MMDKFSTRTELRLVSLIWKRLCFIKFQDLPHIIIISFQDKPRLFYSAVLYFLIFSASAFFPSRLPAANIELGQDAEMRCNIVLNGQIELGDADTLAALIDISQADYYNTHEEFYDKRVCFNSRGGSLAEAFRILEVLRKYGAGSAVGRDAVCESACAIAFLGGYKHFDDGIGELNRVIHPTAKLGFHAPNLIVPSGQYSEDQVAAAFRVALSSIARLIELSRQYKDLVSPSLLSVFLRTPPEEMRYVETVFDANTWNVFVSFVDYPTAGVFEALGHRWRHYDRTKNSMVLPESSRLEAFGNACLNHLQNVNQPAWISFLGGEIVDVVVTGEEWGEFQIYFPHSEDISSQASPEIQVHVGYLGILGDHFVECPAYLYLSSQQPFQYYPPQIALSRLAEVKGNSMIEFDRMLHSEPSFGSCWLTSSTAGITNVNEYVNLRRQPDFSAPIVRRAPLGETVRLVQANSMWFVEAQPGRELCFEACQAVEANTQDTTAAGRVRQCIDDNRLWYEVQDSRGSRGWVSRKFLEEMD